MDLSDKVAIVTGGGRGIGRGIVLVLARQGASVVVTDINAVDAERTAAEVDPLGRQSMSVALDVTDQPSVDAMVKAVVERHGRVDVLVNNAGVVGAPGWEERGGKLSEMDWDLVYAVNVKGMARVTQAVTDHMRPRRYGKVVNIASVAGRKGTVTSYAYSTSKAAVINMTQSQAQELAPFSINVNAVCPGLIWSPLWERIGARWAAANPQYHGMTARQVFDDFVRLRTPLGREQSPEDIGNAVAFLASDFASNITGQALNVDGGSMMN
ncbi:MAG: SDR family oxidoreductase [SAR202 cluster bacterium]|nr:SDR family oxidoreductase [SAR202 cluster bacterium]